MKKLAVIALGGNSIIKKGEKGTIKEQIKNSYETCEFLINLLKKDYNIIYKKLTHSVEQQPQNNEPPSTNNPYHQPI